MSTKQKDSNAKEQDPDFHGAALIDEDGNEIPITEDMVQEACSDLDQQPDQSDEKKTPSDNK